MPYVTLSFAVSVSSSSFLSLSLFGALQSSCGNGRNNTIWYYLFSLLTLPFLYNRVYIVRMVHQFISQTKILNVVLYATSIMNYKVYFIQGYRWYTNWNKIHGVMLLCAYLATPPLMKSWCSYMESKFKFQTTFLHLSAETNDKYRGPSRLSLFLLFEFDFWGDGFLLC